MYQTENEFSKALVAMLKKHDCFVTRIESHSTSNGIPDLFICHKGKEQWIELKTDTKQSIKQDTFKVAWRPGQQAWYHEYRRRLINKWVVTLMSCADGWVVISNFIIFKSNIVSKDNCVLVPSENGIDSLFKLLIV